MKGGGFAPGDIELGCGEGAGIGGRKNAEMGVNQAAKQSHEGMPFEFWQGF